MDYGLKGKVVLVQGASSGLGFAIAKAFAKEGATVALSSSNEKKIQDAAKKIPGATPFVADFFQEGSGSALVWQVIEKLGSIDILVTNSVGPSKGLFHEIKIDEWQKGFQSLYISVLESIQEAYHHMKEKEYGRIIISSSFAAKEPSEQLTISSCLRSGLLGLTKTLAHQFAKDNITVNTLLPGYIATESVKMKFKDQLTSIEKSIPACRLGTPEEYAAAALFLASTQASYLTGQAIGIDGGLTRGI